MRALQQVVTEQPDTNITVISTVAVGARAASVAIKQTAAPGQGTFSIDDTLQLGVGNQVFRAAQMYTQTPDAQSPDQVLTYLLGNVLSLSNQSGGAVRSIVTLYDELSIPPSGNYQSYYNAATLAALAVFTSPTASTQRSANWLFVVTGNRAFTFAVDVSFNNALTWIEVATVAVAAAGGGPAVLPVTMAGQLYRVRLTNNDAALLLTYTIGARVQY